MCRQCRPSPPSSARVRIRRSSGLCSDPKLCQTNRLQSTAVFAAMSTSKVEVGRSRCVSKGPCFCNAAPMPRDPGPRRPPVSSRPKQKIIYPLQFLRPGPYRLCLDFRLGTLSQAAFAAPCSAAPSPSQFPEHPQRPPPRDLNRSWGHGKRSVRRPFGQWWAKDRWTLGYGMQKLRGYHPGRWWGRTPRRATPLMELSFGTKLPSHRLSRE